MNIIQKEPQNGTKRVLMLKFIRPVKRPAYTITTKAYSDEEEELVVVDALENYAWFMINKNSVKRVEEVGVSNPDGDLPHHKGHVAESPRRLVESLLTQVSTHKKQESVSKS